MLQPLPMEERMPQPLPMEGRILQRWRRGRRRIRRVGKKCFRKCEYTMRECLLKTKRVRTPGMNISVKTRWNTERCIY